MNFTTMNSKTQSTQQYTHSDLSALNLSPLRVSHTRAASKPQWVNISHNNSMHGLLTLWERETRPLKHCNLVPQLMGPHAPCL